MSLSRALCLPTSSLVAITFPSLSIKELACIPPVLENSDCSFVKSSGEMGYFQGGIRTASVKTTKQSELLRAPYLNLTHYFEHVPRVANAFLEVIQQRQANVK